MNRTEALHILGLEDDATADDIKIAYRETVQILHPDKFAGNEKLQNRATEQFKRLQEAYDLLSSGAGGGRGGKHQDQPDLSPQLPRDQQQRNGFRLRRGLRFLFVHRSTASHSTTTICRVWLSVLPLR